MDERYLDSLMNSVTNQNKAGRGPSMELDMDMEAAERELARLDELLKMADQSILVDQSLEDRLRAFEEAAKVAASHPAPKMQVQDGGAAPDASAADLRDDEERALDEQLAAVEQSVEEAQQE
ncbi:MAG: hypothetical protein IJP92_06535, partial [Lachnospiraceae bacterium]|nr:hypothetical protein [Lachnospiraceae bacterium]